MQITVLYLYNLQLLGGYLDEITCALRIRAQRAECEKQMTDVNISIKNNHQVSEKASRTTAKQQKGYRSCPSSLWDTFLSHCKMKCNHPPDDSEELQNEQEIIDSRLNEQFLQPSRSVPMTNKGYWLDNHGHVKLESIRGVASELVRFSSTLKYHYLNPFEALYCLETSQLIIFFNGFPLSLAEAYQILIDDPIHFRNYRVFQQLNRSGYVCLKPSSIQELEGEKSSISSPKKVTPHVPQLSGDNCEPLFKLGNTIPIPIEVLTALKARGPHDYQPNLGLQQRDLLQDVIFDVYKRETFVKNKPRKDRSGIPDYKLIIRDKTSDIPPNMKQLTYHDVTRTNEKESYKLMFASVDDDCSICFNQFENVNPERLELF